MDHPSIASDPQDDTSACKMWARAADLDWRDHLTSMSKPVKKRAKIDCASEDVDDGASTSSSDMKERGALFVASEGLGCYEADAAGLFDCGEKKREPPNPWALDELKEFAWIVEH
eukprot:140583-Amphidinium_carterae.1